MKALILTVFTLACALNLISQNFAPIGATWHYTEQFAFSGDISYLKIEATKDTVVNGKDCRILSNNGGLECAYFSEQDFVYTEDSVVYFYVKETDSFQVLYDLKADKDSSWITVFETYIGEELDTVLVSVDSVNAIVINSKELIRMYVTYEMVDYEFSGHTYPGVIIESIGDTYYLFNLFGNPDIACDGNYSAGLRCYEDSDLGFYSTGIADSCTYTYKWIGVEMNSANLNINIYPNPTPESIDISIDSEKLINAELRDLTGKLIRTHNFVSKTKIDLSDFPTGLYLLTIQQGGIMLDSEKIMKQ